MSCEHATKVPWKDCGECKKCGEDGICDLCLYGDLNAPADQYKGPLHKCPTEIRVCTACLTKGHEVPLIWSFAFNGAEYWCPMCGDSLGMLGAGTKVEWSPKLEDRMKRYKRTFSAYLDAHGALNCAELLWDGKWTKPRDLPQTEIDRLLELQKTAWKPGVVIL